MDGKTIGSKSKLTNHFQRTRLITLSTDKHCSLDSEDDFAQVVETSVTINSSVQNYRDPHADDRATLTSSVVSRFSKVSY